MLVAFDTSGERIVASQTKKDKSKEAFACPGCGGYVALKKGSIVIHHFAHHPGSTCAYGTGETRLHLECKDAIYRWLLKAKANGADIKDISLELYMDGNSAVGASRADVFARIDGYPVAFEIQHSKISADVIADRSLRYSKRGISVCWLVPLPSRGNAPSAMEWEMMSMYGGSIYYLNPDTGLVHIMGAQLDYSYVDYCEWYEPGGVHCDNGGGYWYKLKNRVHWKYGPIISISQMQSSGYGGGGAMVLRAPNNVKQLPENLKVGKKALEKSAFTYTDIYGDKNDWDGWVNHLAERKKYHDNWSRMTYPHKGDQYDFGIHALCYHLSDAMHDMVNLHTTPYMWVIIMAHGQIIKIDRGRNVAVINKTSVVDIGGYLNDDTANLIISAIKAIAA